MNFIIFKINSPFIVFDYIIQIKIKFYNLFIQYKIIIKNTFLHHHFLLNLMIVIYIFI